MRWVQVRRAASNCHTVSRGAIVCSRRMLPYNGDVVGGLVIDLLRQLFVVLNQVRDVDVAKVLFRQNVVSDLITAKVLAQPKEDQRYPYIPVNEGIVHGKGQDEIDQLLLHLSVALLALGNLALLLTPEVE